MLWCTLALAVCYIAGTAWYMLVTNAGVIAALGVCVVPFIPFDIIKLYGAYVIAKAIRKRIKMQM